MEKRSRKVPGVKAHYRTTISSRISPSCILVKERRVGNMKVVNHHCCNLDREIWGFLQESANNLDQGAEKIAGFM